MPLPTTKLTDNFGRSFSYLRLSVTNVCNFRCSYCLPNGYQKSDACSHLSVEEIKNLVAGFASIGVSKIRLTGGEPTVRKDFTDIIRTLANTDGINKLSFTTNGYSLKKNAREFFDAGISSVNVSIDSLDQKNFAEITGHDKLKIILEGIDEAFAVGFRSVKINSVLLRGINDHELDSFISFVKDKPLTSRFIELMQTGDNHDYFKKHHLSSEIISEKLRALGWKISPREFDSGPATEYQHPDSRGKIGIIAPYSKGFCDSCNRLRVTASGDLRLCLFGTGSFSLRPFLQNSNQKKELQEKIIELLHLKTASHFLSAGESGLTSNLSALGG